MEKTTKLKTPTKLESYWKAAKSIYAAFAKKPDPFINKGYYITDNYWQAGCVFDTITDYLAEAIKQKEITAKEANTFVSDVKSNWAKTLEKGGGGYWYDDFGWWGIASAKAGTAAYKEVFGPDNTDDFTGYASECWKIMSTGKSDNLHFGAPKVWEKCTSQDFFASVAPKYPNGVWQYDIFKERRAAAVEDNQTSSNPSTPLNIEYKDGKYTIISEKSAQAKIANYKNEFDLLPKADQFKKESEELNILETKANDYIYSACGLGPFQLTVVNGLYLILGLRLANQGNANASVSDLEKVFGFINNWVYGKDTPKGNGLFNETTGLMRERVSTYAGGDSVYNYHPDTAWGGDQGLILGGLVDYIRFAKDPNPNAQKLINAIIDGVCKSMVTNTKNPTILPWYPFKVIDDYSGSHQYPSPAPLEIWDYPGGSGIFMRYLLYAYKWNKGVKNTINDKTSAIHKLIMDSADACVDESLTFVNNNAAADELWFNQNKLAILTMAAHILGEQ